MTTNQVHYKFINDITLTEIIVSLCTSHGEYFLFANSQFISP